MDRRSIPHGRFIPEDVAAKLLSPELLTEWSPYSILRRLALIKTKYGIEVTKEALTDLYRSNGVTLRKPHTVPYRSFHHRPGLRDERRLFCIKLITLIKSNASLCYID